MRERVQTNLPLEMNSLGSAQPDQYEAKADALYCNFSVICGFTATISWRYMSGCPGEICGAACQTLPGERVPSLLACTVVRFARASSQAQRRVAARRRRGPDGEDTGRAIVHATPVYTSSDTVREIGYTHWYGARVSVTANMPLLAPRSVAFVLTQRTVRSQRMSCGDACNSANHSSECESLLFACVHAARELAAIPMLGPENSWLKGRKLQFWAFQIRSFMHLQSAVPRHFDD